ncbi:M1 family aminopeptidase [Ornithinimicrobium cryptoxanthini]|uniref:M1 family aminopeptidase n=1 Tax=Ornithinimicrobium cryptoxanthini TaxID=2934161 RepID=UPI00211888B6|nr:M1 family aminopeptidase [Ornithinimicrobium cryptoxanthini]
MYRSKSALISLVAAASLILPAGAVAHGDRDRPDPQPGAVGVGDPYFPTDGNGGYDVRHYDLDLRYDPETDVLDGRAKISARATQRLSSFNLDLQGLEVESVRVDGKRARWERDGDELTVTPRRALRDDRRFQVVVTYSGIPEAASDILGAGGFLHTDDGALAVGQPHAAATWFPVNDHPIDKASYDIEITVPKGLEAISNGVLKDRDTRRGWTTWEWSAREPMASYLTVLAIGDFDLRKYREDGIRYWDAVDVDLVTTSEARTGEYVAGAVGADLSYQRLGRTLSVPAGGASLTFWLDRRVEPEWDFMIVEAAPAGTGDWTTLPPLEGHATQSTGFGCQNLLGIHPFLEHYLTPDGFDCTPTGTTGDWWAATGVSAGYEQWTIDLGAYAGGDVQVAISYVSDEVVSLSGLFVDDVVVSTGEGTTSFEDDGDPLDGWTVLGAPPDSPGNVVDWAVMAGEEIPPTTGEIIDAALARQPEVIDFLAGIFGDYPFRTAGAIVDDYPELFFALETQTRPIYGLVFFSDEFSAESVVVHELAHQWTGDLLTVEQWQHIWLNEGFATYTEWLWAEWEGWTSAQEIFEGVTSAPADDPFWEVIIGDPGPDLMFDFAVYYRGAATLHALRLLVGDDAFFTILSTWVEEHEGGHVTTDDFIAHAEQVSGIQLDEFFEQWLFTAAKPSGLPEVPALMSSESLQNLLVPDLHSREQAEVRH